LAVVIIVMTQKRFETVLAAAQMGTEWAVAALHQELNPRILRYIKALGVASPSDVAARVWEELASNLAGFDGNLRSFRRWVFGLARAEAFGPDRHRSAQGEDAPRAESPFNLASMEAEGQSMVEESLAQISALPQDQAEVVLLRILGELTPVEVSEILGTRPGTVRNLEQQGLERLRMATALASLERAMEGS
jgi:RNA polymerase sigma-70 factor (ECF subfamily)